MSLIDKARNKLEEAKGKIKEETGKALGNERMTHEGRLEQGKANMRQFGEQVKDAAAKARNAFRG